MLGGVTGGLALGWHAHRRLGRLLEGTPEEVDSRVTLMLLTRGLRLSEEERRSVRAVLEKEAAEHSRLREMIEPDLARLRAREREEIRALLTPSQQGRLDTVLARLDERRRRVGRLLDH